MLFNSFAFLAFFVVVLCGAAVLPHKPKNRFLLAASYFFYGCWDWRFCFLLGLITLSDFWIAKQIKQSSTKQQAKRWLIGSITIDLGILGFFKYLNFLQDSLIDLASTVGLNLSGPWLHVVLPIGISFYVFQSISYTTDVFRRRIEPVASIWDYALYVSLFPQLVAGPVERANQLLPQVIGTRRVSGIDIQEGLLLISWGLCKKIFVADNLGVRVDRIFAEPSQPGSAVFVGIVCFAFQIYADFSGYTDIARGTGRLLGFKLSLNFRQPFFSRNPTEFWQRWHISLSTWLRDYLFIPLGGFSPFPGRVLRAMMLVMILGGLWHGAAYNFLLWGTFHGALLVGHQLWKKYQAPRFRVDGKILSPLVAVASSLLLFTFVLYGMLLFRSGSIGQIVSFSAELLTFSYREGDLAILVRTLPYIAPLLAWDVFAARNRDEFWLLQKPVIIQSFFYVACFYLIVVLGYAGTERFIYFDF